jgi:SAM-dependent methyltransferase
MQRQIVIETKPGDPIPEEAAGRNWHEAMRARQAPGWHNHIQRAVRVDKDFLQEKHHDYYGRPWVLGKYIFEYARSRGLRSEHKLLDCGCGSGRFAIWAIDYLQEGGYHGIDIHRNGLEALVSYEIPLHGLESKQPRVLLNGQFAFDYFGMAFDWVFDCFVAFHFMQADQLWAFYRSAARVLKPGGRLLCLPRPKLSDEQLRELNLVLHHHATQPCPMLEGHDYIAHNEWFEFLKIGEPG